MIKIIKEGTRKKQQCENCGCLFLYDSEDIEHEEFFYTMQHIGGHREYIKCPQCHEQIILVQTRNGSTINRG